MLPGNETSGVGARLLGLGTRKLVLASASPRRAALLRELGLVFDVRPAAVEETLDAGETPEAAAERLAAAKVRAAARAGEEALVVGADTLVAVDGLILGKPRDPAEAARMLTSLSGRTHRVVTGVAVRSGREGREVSGREITRVTFRSLHPAEIDLLARSGESLDKAGGYGIQGLAALAVTRIEGDYSNVVGLPLGLLRRLILEATEA